jgi:DNA polymerase I-like protein with 3'-5' exonuclease and polymerase domains
MLAEFLAEHDIVGQNFKYDQDKLRRLGFIIRSLASDTMLKGFAINPELPKKLEFFTSIYTEEPYYKDEGMYEGPIESLLTGCSRDACVTKEIDIAMDADLDELNLRPFYENFILPLHSAYLDIESEGFYLDNEKRDELLAKYIEWSERLQYELYKLTDIHINVNSPKQVAKLLYITLGLPERKGTGRS